MPNVLVITGMHRSATSLIASLFQRAGVTLGAQLLPADQRNPRGFFEDVDFYEFHERALRERGQSILVDRTFQFTPTADEDARANELLAARAPLAVWGWKDPRTSLFLEFWRAKIPDAHFLFVYRHPFDVLRSLMRRKEWHMFGLLEGLDAWYAYNERLLAMRATAPAQTLLCNCYTALERIERFSALTLEKFALALQLEQARAAVYAPSDLQRTLITDELNVILNVIHPDAMNLYRRLNQAADMAAVETPAPDTSREVQALAQYARALDERAPLAARRGLLFALLGVQEPALLESFVETHSHALAFAQDHLAASVKKIERLEQELAQLQRASHEQRQWVEPRMETLRALEATRVVRLLQRLERLQQRNQQ